MSFQTIACFSIVSLFAVLRTYHPPREERSRMRRPVISSPEVQQSHEQPSIISEVNWGKPWILENTPWIHLPTVYGDLPIFVWSLVLAQTPNWLPHHVAPVMSLSHAVAKPMSCFLIQRTVMNQIVGTYPLYGVLGHWGNDHDLHNYHNWRIL